ncbi:unnamed protein product [Amoebophrya sp. A120]|nr:unnamed protein product [Amoebophrya sp. A120]|eukprot:GSA120T00014161001.1
MSQTPRLEIGNRKFMKMLRHYLYAASITDSGHAAFLQILRTSPETDDEWDSPFPVFNQRPSSARTAVADDGGPDGIRRINLLKEFDEVADSPASTNQKQKNGAGAGPVVSPGNDDNKGSPQPGAQSTGAAASSSTVGDHGWRDQTPSPRNKRRPDSPPPPPGRRDRSDIGTTTSNRFALSPPSPEHGGADAAEGVATSPGDDKTDVTTARQIPRPKQLFGDDNVEEPDVGVETKTTEAKLFPDEINTAPATASATTVSGGSKGKGKRVQLMRSLSPEDRKKTDRKSYRKTPGERKEKRKQGRKGRSPGKGNKTTSPGSSGSRGAPSSDDSLASPSVGPKRSPEVQKASEDEANVVDVSRRPIFPAEIEGDKTAGSQDAENTVEASPSNEDVIAVPFCVGSVGGQTGTGAAAERFFSFTLPLTRAQIEAQLAMHGIRYIETVRDQEHPDYFHKCKWTNRIRVLLNTYKPVPGGDSGEEYLVPKDLLDMTDEALEKEITVETLAKLRAKHENITVFKVVESDENPIPELSDFGGKIDMGVKNVAHRRREWPYPIPKKAGKAIADIGNEFVTRLFPHEEGGAPWRWMNVFDLTLGDAETGFRLTEKARAKLQQDVATVVHEFWDSGVLTLHPSVRAQYHSAPMVDADLVEKIYRVTPEFGKDAGAAFSEKHKVELRVLRGGTGYQNSRYFEIRIQSKANWVVLSDKDGAGGTGSSSSSAPAEKSKAIPKYALAFRFRTGFDSEGPFIYMEDVYFAANHVVKKDAAQAYLFPYHYALVEEDFRPLRHRKGVSLVESDGTVFTAGSFFGKPGTNLFVGSFSMEQLQTLQDKQHAGWKIQDVIKLGDDIHPFRTKSEKPLMDYPPGFVQVDVTTLGHSLKHVYFKTGSPADESYSV